MKLLDFIVGRSAPVPQAPGGSGPSDLDVPVASPRPVGKIEWAEVGPFLYGVDRAGNVWRLSAW